MGLRDRMLAGFASQLGKPSGLRGLVVGTMLNRTNRGMIADAVDALELKPGATAADLGFGGGVGLAMLLQRVGPQGRVLGVDLSPTMVRRVSGQFGREIAAGRMRLHLGSLTKLPLEDGSVQGAITVNTIYFIAELDSVFSELARVITNDGRVVVGIGDPENMAHMPMTAHGYRLRPVDDVVAAAKSAGLSLQDHRRAGEGDAAAHLLLFAHASS
ncbi:MAG TPA: methyltransferase domain-containing protein [Candidatus Dormibacteraeota bacterium]